VPPGAPGSCSAQTAWICFSDLPLVSGTFALTQKKVIMHSTANSKNVAGTNPCHMGFEGFVGTGGQVSWSLLDLIVVAA